MYSRDLLRALRVVFLHISHGQVFRIITQQPQKQRLPHSATWGTHLSCFVGWAEHPNPSLTLSSLSHLLRKAELYSGHILYNTQDLPRGTVMIRKFIWKYIVECCMTISVRFQLFFWCLDWHFFHIFYFYLLFGILLSGSLVITFIHFNICLQTWKS